MNQEEASEVIRKVLDDIAPELATKQVDPDADLGDVLELDSMDFLNLVAGVREATGVDIPESDFPRISTMARFAAYLELAGDQRGS